jgi:RNA polymerase sigma-70 factor (ECF subfamily)
MLGSVHEAEDVTQETFIRAWRNFAGFDGRGPFRAWLYRIATNACLDALARRKRSRRVLPNQRRAGLGAVPEHAPVGARAADVAWLEPYPDRLLEGIADEAPNPEARYAAREAVRLAFVAVIQQLPPRQRAVLLLADVLGWPVAEIASTLGRTPASVNSALQRARETLARHYRNEAPVAAPDARQARLVQRYIEAWEALDLDGFVALLKEDASLVMPPFPQWYFGRRAIADFHKIVWKDYGGFRLVATGANGQPACALYARPADGSGDWRAHSLHVLTLEGADIAALTLFVPPEGPRLFEAFGLPPTLDGEP